MRLAPERQVVFMGRLPCKSFPGFALLVVLCFGLAGCTRAPEEAGKPPPTVTVSYPLQREVTDYQDYTGRTAAVDSVQVQARVNGYLSKVLFTEGVEVEEGTQLYEIDPSPYQAAYDAARAQVDQQAAALELAKQNFDRAKTLNAGRIQAIAAAEFQQYESQQRQAIANLDYAKANRQTAKLNLDWTEVNAPIPGIAGQLLVTRGNLIVANQTILTTIVRQDPMWVYFNIDEPTALHVRELARQGKFGNTREGPPKITFHLQLQNEKGFPHEALFDFVNNQLDQATATLLVRAVFPNPKPANGPRVFTPNLFVRVRVPTSPPYQAVLVTPAAVGTDQDLKYLFVVDADNKVVRRAVQLGTIQDGLQVITDGVKVEDRVIVKGIQRVQQGATVNPTLVPMPEPSQTSNGPMPLLKAPAQLPKK
jgi:RND family efflux transporter MFP subunit